MHNSLDIWRHVDTKSGQMVDLADRVWDTPEILYNEVRSSSAHIDELRRQGFRIQTGVAGIPTAIIGEAGDEGPIIAILGEFDALPGLSQEAGIAEPRPVPDHHGLGHGCGHNLLGAGALLAATAVKDWLGANGLKGRVRYYGCPAEEGGAAKTFMVREGLFDDVDIAISWHPKSFLEVAPAQSLANIRIDFSFAGRAAHAASAPHLGRSALDAAELMNIGVNYLREHMEGAARIHYAYLNAGGPAPNVVQSATKLRYVIRHSSTAAMRLLVERVRRVAEGAAHMTETSVKVEIVSALSNLLGNEPLEQEMDAQLQLLGPPRFEESDRAYARQIQATLTTEDIRSAYLAVGLPFAAGKELCDVIVPRGTRRTMMLESTDVGDVSWVVPLVQLHGATCAVGTPLHSWQMTAQGKSGHAHKGMIHAAKVMAATAVAALQKPELIEQAKRDLARRLGGEPYDCPIPPDIKPPLDMAKAV
ncbi:MAG: amidohydrolase [Xanthobacteraceae bacterium]